MGRLTETIILRASPDFVAQLNAAAQAEGVSKSDVIRRAVQEREDRTVMGAPDGALRDIGHPSCADENNFAHLAAAAQGDLAPLRVLAQQAWRLAIEAHPDLDSYKLLIEGLVFARLAASRGDPSDTRLFLRLAQCLAQLIGPVAAADELAEAIARIAAAADAGDEASGDLLPTLVESFGAEVSADAALMLVSIAPAPTANASWQ